MQMQNAKYPVQNGETVQINGGLPALALRIFDFSVAVVQLVDALPNSLAGRHIAGQLLRSGTSVAANYEETCAAESRADFIHKLQVSLKELRESRFWLRLLCRTGIDNTPCCQQLLQEANELCGILGKSVITAKSKVTSKKPTV